MTAAAFRTPSTGGAEQQEVCVETSEKLKHTRSSYLAGAGDSLER